MTRTLNLKMSDHGPRLVDAQVDELARWFSTRQTAELSWIVTVQEACKLVIHPALRKLDVRVIAVPAEIEDPYVPLLAQFALNGGTETVDFLR